MDLVIRRHLLPNKDLMKTSKDKPKKKEKNVSHNAVQGKTGKIYIPHQKVGETPLPDKSKGLKRARREAKLKHKEQGSASKKHKESE